MSKCHFGQVPSLNLTCNNKIPSPVSTLSLFISFVIFRFSQHLIDQIIQLKRCAKLRLFIDKIIPSITEFIEIANGLIVWNQLQRWANVYLLANEIDWMSGDGNGIQWLLKLSDLSVSCFACTRHTPNFGIISIIAQYLSCVVCAKLLRCRRFKWNL